MTIPTDSSTKIAQLRIDAMLAMLPCQCFRYIIEFEDYLNKFLKAVNPNAWIVNHTAYCRRSADGAPGTTESSSTTNSMTVKYHVQEKHFVSAMTRSVVQSRTTLEYFLFWRSAGPSKTKHKTISEQMVRNPGFATSVYTTLVTQYMIVVRPRPIKLRFGVKCSRNEIQR